MDFFRPEYWSGKPFPSPGDLPRQGIEPRSPALQVDSLPAEPPEKPKNTGVGSLSLLQRIFPTQDSNWGLLHGRQILYQPIYGLLERCGHKALFLNGPPVPGNSWFQSFLPAMQNRCPLTSADQICSPLHTPFPQWFSINETYVISVYVPLLPSWLPHLFP